MDDLQHNGKRGSLAQFTKRASPMTSNLLRNIFNEESYKREVISYYENTSSIGNTSQKVPKCYEGVISDRYTSGSRSKKLDRTANRSQTSKGYTQARCKAQLHQRNTTNYIEMAQSPPKECHTDHAQRNTKQKATCRKL